MNTLMKLTKTMCIAAVMLTGKVIGADNESAAPAPLVTAAKQRKGEIVDMLRHMGSDPLSQKRRIEEILDHISDRNDADTRSEFLNELFSLSLAQDRGRPPKPYVPEEVLATCLVCSLLDPNSEVRSQALSYISDYTLPSAYSNHVEQLIAAWPGTKSFALVRIIAGIGTDRGKDFLRGLENSGVQLPEEVRARLGDAGAEQALIKRFGAETNALAKSELALKLGYVGSPGAVLALAKELRSPLVVEERYYHCALRYKILEALGRAFPHEPMFNEELNQVAHGPRYGLKVDQRKYFDKVESWAEKAFGIVWKNPRPSDPLDEETRVPHPLP
jgi:hypothetical protein